jgi:hypothetical protein
MAELKITASDKKRIDLVADKLSKERSKLEDAVSVFNEAVNTARNALSIQIDSYLRLKNCWVKMTPRLPT